MKFNVAIIIDTKPQSGGGIQAINTAINLSNINNQYINYKIYATDVHTHKILYQINNKANLIKINFLDKILVFLSKNIFFNFLIKRLKFKTIFESKLLNENIKFIYFPSPSNKFEYLNTLNFSTTVWDLCHLQYKEFPEVYSYKEFDLREYHYNRVLKKSSFIITESEELSNLVCKSYNVERGNIISLPLSINRVLNKEYSNIRKASFEIPKKFFFYPAQFWPHKNHINILKAFQKVCSEYTDWYLIFCGSNTGNLDYLKKQTEILGLEENVIFKEYIEDEDMYFFYQNCSCVIMTTFFGPTNIPPLEAWYFNKPLIYSEHLSKNIEGAALFVNPLDKISISDAMFKVIRSDGDIKSVLDNAKKVMKKLDLEREKSYLSINNSIDKIRRISELYE